MSDAQLTSNMANSPSQRRRGDSASLPLLVGVVGDDAREGDAVILNDRLRDFFNDLAGRYPASPRVLLVPMRTSGERLAAQMALECGMELCVPDVTPRDEPAETPAGERDEGRPLEQVARRVTGSVSLESLPAGFNPGKDDGLAAALPSAFVTRNCHVFVALWDGAPSRQSGDAGDAVRFRLEGLPQRLETTASRLDDEGVGVVDQLVAPQGKGAPLPQDAFGWRRLAPAQWGGKSEVLADAARCLEMQEAFNADVARWSSALGPECAGSRSRLLPDDVVSRASPSFRALLDRYALADVLAIRFQATSLAILRGVIVLGLVAALALQLSDSLPWGAKTSTALYLTALLAAMGLYLWARRKRFENRYLDYRALAEGLRVEVFWRLAGRKETVADLYLRRQRGELDWIRAALLAWDVLDDESRAGADPLGDCGVEDRFRLVQEHWVENQREYYTQRAVRQGTIDRRYELLKKICFYISASQAFLKVLLPSAHPLLGAFGLTLLVAGLLHLYAKTRAFAEHARQYERLGTLFDRAARVLRQAVADKQWTAASAVMAEVGREALQENADWLLLHRERPVSVPGLG
ncbi:MAG: hypothetical protein ACT4QC_22855 [Planctomycetaceae bacterium]